MLIFSNASNTSGEGNAHAKSVVCVGVAFGWCDDVDEVAKFFFGLFNIAVFVEIKNSPIRKQKILLGPNAVLENDGRPDAHVYCCNEVVVLSEAGVLVRWVGIKIVFVAKLVIARLSRVC